MEPQVNNTTIDLSSPTRFQRGVLQRHPIARCEPKLLISPQAGRFN
jgi:hypothetical protein